MKRRWDLIYTQDREHPEREQAIQPTARHRSERRLWPYPANVTVRIFDPDYQGLAIDVEVNFQDGACVVTGIAVRSCLPLRSSLRATDEGPKIQWDEDAPVRLVGGSEVSRMPLGRYIAAALTMTKNPGAFEQDPGRSLLPKSRTTKFYDAVVSKYDRYRAEGVKGAAAKIAEELNKRPGLEHVTENLVYQWVHKWRKRAARSSPAATHRGAPARLSGRGKREPPSRSRER